MTGRKRWHQLPAMYVGPNRKGEFTRLIPVPGPDGGVRWEQEELRPVSRSLMEFDFASIELSLLEQYAMTRAKDEK
jgi:hypothetical protein